uniref:Uncharacterized protein n=1 Tax=Anguilla anguilla TaxID=7936 RepID=A0A0E9VCX5_ANGAN
MNYLRLAYKEDS